MPYHNERKILPFSAEQMFVLVADIRSYPEFLPWVNGMRVKSDSDTETMADMIVGFKGFSERFTSRVLKTAHQKIEVEYLDGPMKHLQNIWIFEENADGGCTIDFTVDFAFKNKMFQMLAGQFFDKALSKMIDAFVKRAEELYDIKR